MEVGFKLGSYEMFFPLCLHIGPSEYTDLGPHWELRDDIQLSTPSFPKCHLHICHTLSLPSPNCDTLKCLYQTEMWLSGRLFDARHCQKEISMDAIPQGATVPQ